MCFGGGSSAPKQAKPTTFSYTAADNSNAQQRAASTVSTTQDAASFGSSLGMGGTEGGTPAATAGARSAITGGAM